MKFHKVQVDIIQIDEYNDIRRKMFYGLFDYNRNC